MNREQILRRRIQVLLWVFILGLVVSGVTAIPLQSELNWLVKVSGARQLVDTSAATAPPVWALWLTKVEAALDDTGGRYPFLYYGTDWLAFGHFMIALVFLGAVRDPVRNAWLFRFGLLACLLVIPYAFVFGALRGIPLWWRGVDCSFGVFGLVPLWCCLKWVKELKVEAVKVERRTSNVISS
jgi:hypothetical protein